MLFFPSGLALLLTLMTSIDVFFPSPQQGLAALRPQPRPCRARPRRRRRRKHPPSQPPLLLFFSLHRRVPSRRRVAAKTPRTSGWRSRGCGCASLDDVADDDSFLLLDFRPTWRRVVVVFATPPPPLLGRRLALTPPPPQPPPRVKLLSSRASSALSFYFFSSVLRVWLVFVGASVGVRLSLLSCPFVRKRPYITLFIAP